MEDSFRGNTGRVKKSRRLREQGVSFGTAPAPRPQNPKISLTAQCTCADRIGLQLLPAQPEVLETSRNTNMATHVAQMVTNAIICAALTALAQARPAAAQSTGNSDSSVDPQALTYANFNYSAGNTVDLPGPSVYQDGLDKGQAAGTGCRLLVAKLDATQVPCML